MSDTEQHPSGDKFAEQDTNGYLSFRFDGQDMRLKTPPIVGYWVMFQGQHINITLAMYRRPRWLTRWAMRVVFDIHWRDA